MRRWHLSSSCWWLLLAVRPLQELRLQGCSVDDLKAVAECSTLSALTALTPVLCRSAALPQLFQALGGAVDRCRGSLRQLRVQTTGPWMAAGSVDLGSLPELEHFQLTHACSLRLDAPRLASLLVSSSTFERSSKLRPSAFPRLQRLRLHDWRPLDPIHLEDLCQWSSLTALECRWSMRSVDSAARRLLLSLPRLCELRLLQGLEPLRLPELPFWSGKRLRFPSLRVLHAEPMSASGGWTSLDLPGLTHARTRADNGLAGAVLLAAPHLRELTLSCDLQSLFPTLMQLAQLPSWLPTELELQAVRFCYRAESAIGRWKA